MAESNPSASAANKRYRRQALLWLMMALLLGVVTALVWMFSQTSAIGTQIENEPITAPQVTVDQLKQPLSIESLHELDTEVQPIDFSTTIRDMRNYPAEFKDKRYLSANKGKWTVQVMNVAEHDVIVSYLEGREDRKKFAYFRYLDDDKQIRYMLTYGIMSSPQQAIGAAKLIDFNLPGDVRVLPEEINRYISVIDNYERSAPIKDLSSQRARSIDLQPTLSEVPVSQDTMTTDDDLIDNELTADTIKDSAERNMAAANQKAQSIRQSEDTSATLSVNEARSFDAESDNDSQNTANLNNSGAEVKKPPVVAAPKPPIVAAPTPPASTVNGSETNSDRNNAPRATKDAIKELIENTVE